MYKYILTLVLGLLALACSPDPDVTIYHDLGFPKCLTPIDFKSSCQFTTITLRFTTFADAEGYELEVYSVEILPDEEPYPEDLIYKDTIKAENVPYSFVGPDETYCYMRLRAINDSEHKEPSDWVYSNEETQVDPSTTCPTPTNAKGKALNRKVSFTWSGSPYVKNYVLEIYNENVVARKDPDQQYLVATYSIPSTTVLPFVIMYPDNDEASYQYWFRLRGTNEDDNLKPSQWVTGTYTTSHYYWPDDDNAFDHGLWNGATRNANFSLLGTAPYDSYLDSNDKVVDGGVTVDGVTFGAKILYSWSDYVYMNKCTQNNNLYVNTFPEDSYIRIDICRPGTFSFLPRIKSGLSVMPEITVALLTTKSNTKSFTYLYNKRLENTSTITKKNEANRISVTVTEDDLYGATGASSLYLFSNLTTSQKDLYIYPVRWTNGQ